MKDHPLLAFLLGIWLGGSVLVGAAVSYNFAGFEDFVPRTPPPPQLAAFQDAHRAYFLADTLRFCLVLTAAGLLLYGGPRNAEMLNADRSQS